MSSNPEDKNPKFNKPRPKKRGKQPPELAQNQHKTNIPGKKRGPYVFDIQEPDDFAALVKSMMELSNEYKKYQDTHKYEAYRRTRTWLRTIRKLSNTMLNNVRQDYIDYTNKDIDKE